MRLQGCSGRGIRIRNGIINIPNNAEMYVQYCPIPTEQRFFIVNGTIVLIVEKRKMTQEELTEFEIERIHPTIKAFRKGWTYSDNLTVQPTQQIKDIVLKTQQVIGLDFGAVDIGFETVEDVKVVEINSNCGILHLSEVSLKKYGKALKNLVLGRPQLAVF